MLIMRKVAQCCWQGKPNDFERFWPLPESKRVDVLKKTWGSAEEARAFIKKVEQAHGIKIQRE